MKEKKRRRGIALILTVCLIIGILPGNALAYDETETSGTFEATGGTVSYKVLEDGTIAITDCEDTVTEVTIPDTIDGKNVTSLGTSGSDGFANKTALTSVVLPAHLNKIFALGGCTNLTNVDFSACTEQLSIEPSAFRGDTNLTSVTLPATVTGIGDYAFSDCSGLTNIDFSSCVEDMTISENAFYMDKALTSVVLPAGLTTLGKQAFAYCEGLTSVDFSACTKLTSIGAQAFIDCVALTEADFSSCKNLTTIDEYAFQEANALTKVVFPKSLSTLGARAFAQCYKLESADLSGTSLTEITEGAFAEAGITTAVLPDSVTAIQENAFVSCKNLSSLTLGAGVQTIGYQAFVEAAITELTLPDTLKSIGNDAFADCKSLTNINWPNNAEFTTVNGFDRCTSLPVSEFNEAMALSSVTAIGDNAFSYCTFAYVNIPTKIQSIGYNAFCGAKNMTMLSIQPGTRSIGACAFADCTGLAGTTVTLPETVEKVGGGAFADCAKQKDAESGEYTGITVEVMNRDFSLLPYEGVISHDMVTIDGVNYANPFGQLPIATVIRAYETNSQGNPSMLKQFYDVVKDETSGSQSRYIFEPLTDGKSYTVSGKIPSDAQMEMFVNDKKISPTLENGSFEASVAEKSKVSVTVSKDGYYNKYFMQASLKDDWDLGDITFSDQDKIPMNNTMQVDFGKVSVNGFQNLEITLKAGDTKLTEGTDYKLQYPYIILTDTVTAEELTLTVNADEIGYTGGSVTAGREEGTFKLSLKPWGKLQITADSEFAGNNHVLIFDDQGNLVGKSSVPKSGLYITDSLKAGTYTVIAFNANSSFSAVSSIDTLDKMGLVESRDYAKVKATVADDKTEEITVTVPLLKTDVSAILDKNKCSVVFQGKTTVLGQSNTMYVYYGFSGDKGDAVSVVLPEKAAVKYVCTDTQQLKEGTDYTINNQIVTITNVQKEGVFYLMLSFGKKGECSVSATATSGAMTAPIGSTSVTVSDIQISPASTRVNSLKGNKVTVMAEPESSVTLFVDGKQAATGKTNKVGHITFTYDLPGLATSGQSFVLTAQSGGASVFTTVTYVAESAVELDRWNFYLTSEYGEPYNGADLYRADGMGAPTFYYYGINGKLDESNNNWTFVATFVGQKAPENVITYVGTLDGEVKEVPMSLLQTESTPNGKYKYKYTFAGELYLPYYEDGVISESQLPESFAIDWEGNEESFIYDKLTVAQIEAEAKAVTEARKQEVEQARTQTTSKLDGVITPVENASEYLFGAKYRLSETMPDWFAKLDTEGQTVVYNMEKAIDESAKNLTEALGLKKNITEYQSWEEVYGELGITMTKNTRTAEELRADGFTVCEDNGSFTAYKDNTDTTEVHALMARLTSGGGVSGVTGGFTYIDGDGNQIDFVGDAAGNTIQSVRNNGIAASTNAYDAFAGYVKNHPDLYDPIGFSILDGLNTGLSATGTAFGFQSVQQDSDAMVDWTVRTEEMQGYIDELKQYEARYVDSPLCSNAIMRERFIAQDIHLLMDNEAYRNGANSIAGAIFMVAGLFDTTPTTDAVSGVYDIATNSVGSRRAAQIQKLMEDLDRQTRVRSSKCKDTDMEKIMKKTRINKRTKPIMDPSGIVYEALESNTLSGVTATVYYADDEYGTNAQVWDAEHYEQINPQITDSTGKYAWDVPAGWWQVRFEKAGYTPAATDWMRVPPPRMGLKTAMVSTEAPEVVSANAYKDYIEVVFSQYMDTTAAITLPAGMTGTWQSIDGGYSKVLHITQTGGFTVGDTVSFELNGAKNYAGTVLGPYHSGNLTVSARPAEVILNYENVISAKAGTEKNITVRIKDSDGNYMDGVTVEAELGSTLLATLRSGSAVTDADGKAVFTMDTSLPGYSNITFKVRGTSLEKTMSLRVTLDENRPKRPTAEIGTTQFTASSPKENYITVRRGEQLTLAAESGVTIYYTTDDTCPCQNSASRKVYTGPITITNNVKFRIAAYKDGMDYSERLNITVTVDDSHQHNYGAEWKADAECHWHMCSCGATTSRTAHDMEIRNAKATTATETGYTGDQVCRVCGYTVQGREIPIGDTTDPTKSNGNTSDSSSEKDSVKSPQTGDDFGILHWFMTW